MLNVAEITSDVTHYMWNKTLKLFHNNFVSHLTMAWIVLSLQQVKFVWNASKYYILGVFLKCSSWCIKKGVTDDLTFFLHATPRELQNAEAET